MPTRHFFGRVGGQRHADRVADPSAQQRAEPHRRLDRADARRAGLGHAEVERVVDLVGEHAVRLDHHQRVGRLERHLHLRVAALLEDVDVAQRRLHHALRRGTAVLSRSRSFSSEPALTPIRMGILRVLGEVRRLP